LRTGNHAPYSVFTPFSRAFMATAQIAKPLAAPRQIPPLPRDVTADEVGIPSAQDLGITRNSQLIAPGENAARERLATFARKHVKDYAHSRNQLADEQGTSRLSQDLKFGTISARTVWHAVEDATYRNELIWREFAHSTLWDRPDVLEHPFRREFESFPWRNDERGWKAWTEGTTGYPVVDAAARQLLATGYVHNRARMIAASFLSKHLMIDYRHGEAHYMRWLTDGDWAQNNFNWQWSAGCGCDAQPWFRIFNPQLQEKKFDADGEYVRRWIPGLAGRDYPAPIVDHADARERFLATAKRHLQR